VAEIIDAAATAVTAALDGALPVAEHLVPRQQAPAGLELHLHPSLG
jgi:lipoyl(octanoyl) transferase